MVGGTVPKEFIPGVEKGLESVLGSGPLAGFPVVDLKVTLIDGKYHDVDSSALAFEICARQCLREALQPDARALEHHIGGAIAPHGVQRDGDLTAQRRRT